MQRPRVIYYCRRKLWNERKSPDTFIHRVLFFRFYLQRNRTVAALVPYSYIETIENLINFDEGQKSVVKTKLI